MWRHCAGHNLRLRTADGSVSVIQRVRRCILQQAFSLTPTLTLALLLVGKMQRLGQRLYKCVEKNHKTFRLSNLRIIELTPQQSCYSRMVSAEHVKV